MSKTCSVCKLAKPEEAFYRSIKAKDGLAGRCRVCDTEYQRARKDQRAAANKRWAQSVKGLAAAEKRKKARQEKAEEAKARFRSHRTIGTPQHARWREQAALRKAAKVKATPPWLDEAHRARLQVVYAITQQLQEATASVYHVDHIVPLISSSVCGLHVWWNLRPIPERENTAKGNIFDPRLYPEQGEVAFPEGDGPVVFRKNTQTKVENDE